MKLWQKDKDIDKRIESFTVGMDRELDLKLAKYDVLGSLAHTRMLNSISLLSDEDLDAVQAELKNIAKEINKGDFIIEDGIEDVHSQVEALLTERIGEAGKKIHSGRSRNDQVLVDLRLFIRSEIAELVGLTKNLFDTLISLSEKHKDKLMPGYTHMQVAMPSSFGLWFGAYAESLIEDLYFFQAAYKVTNQNPLGSAAGYGNSFPLNRTMTGELLGFDTLSYNVVSAQMGRGKTEKALAFAMSSVAATLSRFAMDICLYFGQNFKFISFPDELTTGSSIMPHKNNPDVFELVRGKCNKITALPNEIAAITNNLPSGYHREMQIIKESFMFGIDALKDCLTITDYMLQHIEIKSDILKDARYTYITSVEVVNDMVLSGTPFRDAYKAVGLSIENGSYEDMDMVKHTHEGSIGNLCNDEITQKMERAMSDFGFETFRNAEADLLK